MFGSCARQFDGRESLDVERLEAEVRVADFFRACCANEADYDAACKSIADRVWQLRTPCFFFPKVIAVERCNDLCAVWEHFQELKPVPFETFHKITPTYISEIHNFKLFVRDPVADILCGHSNEFWPKVIAKVTALSSASIVT